MALDNQPSPINTHLLPSLLIGLPSIDKEHDELVAQLDTLVSNPDALPNSEVFSEIMSHLGEQIYDHFTHEENIFKSLAMPAIEIENHVQAHTEILDQYARMNLDLMLGKAFSRTEVLLMIKDWVVGHVIGFDLNITRYLPKTNVLTSEGAASAG